MGFTTLQYCLKECYAGLTRNRLMTFGAVATVMVSLSLFGVFLLFLLNVNHLAHTAGSRLEMYVYLNGQFSDTDATIIETQMIEIPGVRQVRYVPAVEAFSRLKKDLKNKVSLEDLDDVLQNNPLPDSFVVKLKDTALSKQVVKKISKLPHVEDVVYSTDVAGKLTRLSAVVKVFGAVFLLFLGCGTLVLIMNAVRLTLYARRAEIHIMQLVGATHWYIRWPYLLEGLFHGVLGGAFAVLFLWAAYGQFAFHFQKLLPFVSLLSGKIIFYKVMLLLLLSGSALGVFASLISLRRFLVEPAP